MRSLLLPKQFAQFAKMLHIKSSYDRHVPLYDMKIALLEDRPKVRTFIRNHFFVDEPLRMGTVPSVAENADEIFHLQSIGEGNVILAVKPLENEMIIGCVIGSSRARHEINRQAQELSETSKWGRIMRIWAQTEKNSDIFERFGVSRIFNIYALAVHRNYRGWGLGMRLLREAAKLAHQKKFELMSIDATSTYMACCCQKLGFQLINTLPYRCFRNDLGYQIFSPPRPSDAVRTYVMRLS